eukprot:GILI01007565.1.p1 GENE.GILI01007565.1~~GILI01007565.1.p1  ORF type:complete len:702 (-),score=235.28 GILI01007565.1:265-2370(-)
MGCGASQESSSSNTTADRWEIIEKRIPYHPTDAMLAPRQSLWTAFDVAVRNSLTKEDCLKGCRHELQLESLFPKELRAASDAAWESTHLLREKADATINVDPQEWRLYLRFLHDDLQLAALFNGIEGCGATTSDTITKADFTSAQAALAKWGAYIPDPEVVFAEISAGEPNMTFGAFSDWAVKNRMDRENGIQQPAQPAAGDQQPAPANADPAAAPVPTEAPAAVSAESAEQPPADKSTSAEAPNEQAEAEQQPAPSANPVPILAPAPVAAAAAATTVDPAQRRQALAGLQSQLPNSASGTNKSRRQRDAIFAQFTQTATLTAADANKGADNVLALSTIAGSAAAASSISQLAFTAATNGGSLMDRSTFRLYARYLAAYFELLAIMGIDVAATADDSTKVPITQQAFVAAASQLIAWGANIKEGEEAAAYTGLLKGAFVLQFGAFVNWATIGRLDSEADDNVQELNTQDAFALAQKGEPTAEEKAAQEQEGQRLATLWADLRTRLPRLKTKTENDQRGALFKQFDTTEAGAISYAEAEKGSRDLLALHNFQSDISPILRRAFSHAAYARAVATGADPTIPRTLEGVTIERAEFRLFLVYIYNYLLLNVTFESLGFDSKVAFNYSVFATQLVPIVEGWGVEVPSPQTVFEQELDKFGLGVTTFDIFSTWAVDKQIEVQNAQAEQKKAKKKGDGLATEESVAV